MAKIILEKSEAEEYFLSALCNSLGMVESSYGLELKFDDVAYEKAKIALNQNGVSPCYEDVLMQILKQGDKLTLVDREGAEKDAIITIDDVYERMNLVPFSHIAQMIDGDDDAKTGDVILQTVFLKQVIYG